jgi:hypothetical protein
MNDTQWQNVGGQSAGGTGRPLDVEDDDAQIPLNMTGTAESAIAALDAAGPIKKSNGGVLLILGVLAVAGIALYTMRATATLEPTDASAVDAEKKIDQVLNRLSGKEKGPANLGTLLKNSDQVVAMFAADPVKKQVTLDHLQKNPFELFMLKSDTPGLPVADLSDKAKQEELRKLRAELESYKLQSVLSGKTSLAVINNKVVREGEQVGSFIVTQITKKSVIFTSGGNTYSLLMPDKDAPAASQFGAKPTR